MIGDLTKGREKSQTILIEDTADICGRGVLLSFVTNLLDRVDEVHVICFDGGSKENELPIDSERVIIHNGHSDLLGWNKSSELTVLCNLVAYLKDKRCFHGNKKVAIVIDSISPLILYRSTPYTCQTIHRLTDSQYLGCDVEQVVCLLHSDLHDNLSCHLVEHTSSSVIKMRQATTTHHTHCCDVLHKKISGKITNISENFNITEQYQLTDITEVSNVVMVTKQTDEEQVDPAANLTFNLTLSDKEKQARSQVILPYMYDQQRQDATLNKSVGEGKIFYQPDEVDDFDEEDPDDDLDI